MGLSDHRESLATAASFCDLAGGADATDAADAADVADATDATAQPAVEATI